MFNDFDGSGDQDVFSGETGLQNWVVNLVWNGQVIASTTSDADGNFMFSGLGNSTYSVCIEMQGGFTQTSPNGSGTGCSGFGYSFVFDYQFMTWSVNNFAEMPQ